MLIGYTLSPKYCNYAMFYGQYAPSDLFCAKCDHCLSWEYSPEKISVEKSRQYDYSYTQDMQDIFSEKFVAYCKMEYGFEEFKEIEGENEKLYCPDFSRSKLFDYRKRNTKFNNKCNVCDNYHEIIGAHPIYLLDKSPIEDGFYFSDIYFGSGRSKHRLIFIGTKWKEQIERQRFRGLWFEPILDGE